MGRTEDAMAKQQSFLEEQIGEPLTTALVGLSGSGSVGAVAGSLLSGGLGMVRQDRANAAAGGAAGISFTKNRYAALALTGSGRLRLFRTKVKRGRYVIEEAVGDWDRGDVDLAITTSGTVYRVSLTVPADGTAVDLEVIRLGMDGVVGRFATLAGATIA
jgi:hypothetical protein